MLPTVPDLDVTLALHRRLAPDPGATLAWSPFSVACALGLAAAGARGATRDELVAVLAPDGDPDGVAHTLAGASSLDSDADDGTQLAVANSLWLRNELPLADGYRAELAGWPGAALHAADFAADPQGARHTINDDVAKTTRDLIPQLLAPGTIQTDTAAVLVNALYLRTSWLEPFEEDATAPRPFHAASGTREVATMRRQGRMHYAAAHGWRMVTLPAGSDVAVDVLLPDGDSDLAAAEAELTGERLGALYAARGETEVELSLPRFRVTGQASLVDALSGLGVATAFTDDADFSGIAPARMRLDDAVHQAVLRADEAGLEGAAATAAIFQLVSFVEPTEPVVFHVDRPFLAVVRHSPTGAVYFLARVTEP